MWKIIVQMNGDEPSEAEAEEAEQQIVDALDAAGVDYLDVAAG